MNMLAVFGQFEREIILDRIKRGLAHARTNGHIGGGRYKLFSEQQMETTRLIQVEKKSQGFVASKYKVDRSTVSRKMTWLDREFAIPDPKSLTDLERANIGCRSQTSCELVDLQGLNRMLKAGAKWCLF
jgi:hypothetical protein